MPDIVSRIRVEAQGADQAAREIRKLKEAYDQVSESARGLSADVGVGRSDPFTRATSMGGGAVEATTSDVAHRETRSRHEREMLRHREQAHSDYGALMRPQTVQAGFGTVDALSRGQTSGALGTVLSAVGGMAGAIPLVAAGAAALGVQRLADDAYGRFGQFRHSGISQRLGVGAMDAVRESVQLERSGLPSEMVSSFFSAASQSGVNLRNASAQDAARIGMVAAASLGIDPGAVAGLMGTLERAGIDSGQALGARGGMYAVAENVFGRADAGGFIQGIQGLIEGRTSRGIAVGTGSVQHSAGMIAALSATGMTPQAAVSFAQQLQGRGTQAAGLQRPEDIIAFQAMRGEGMSVTDTLMAMEGSPHTVNQRVLEYLQRATGGDEDLLRFRVRGYLGEDTSWSAVDRFIQTGGRPADLGALGLGTDVEEAMLADPTSRGEHAIDASRQRSITSGISIMALEAIANLGNTLLGTNLRVGIGRQFGSSVGLPSGDEIEETVGNINTLTAQNVENLVTSVNELPAERRERALQLIGDPRAATAFSTMQSLRENEDFRDYFAAVMGMTSGRGMSLPAWDEIRGALDDPVLESRMGAIGGFGSVGAELQSGIMTDIRDAVGRDREGRAAINRVIGRKYTEDLMLSGHDDISKEDFLKTIERMFHILESENFVFTDGAWTYQGVGP